MKYEEIQEKASINLQLQNNKKAQKLNEQGITLIALVVTIILLLILAGVTISQIAGSNGLFQRARQAVEKYKNAAEEEQIQIGMLEQYVSDFSVVVGDEGEEKASVTIKTFTVEGNPKEQTIKVNLTIEGEASKIEYSIDNGKKWIPDEEIEEDKTEYEHIFEELALGKSYYVRVKVYDEEEKYVEAISDIVTLSNSITAEEKDVLKDKTYLAEDGSIKTGTMPNNGEISGELSASGEKVILAGYTSGGKITAKDLASQTQATATAEQILSGKTAWVKGTLLTGTMQDKTSEVNDLKNQLEEAKEELKKAEEDLANKQQETKDLKKVIKIGEDLSSLLPQTIQINNINGYKTFSADNFFIVMKKMEWEKTSGPMGDGIPVSINYDAENGTLTIGGLRTDFSLGSATSHGISWITYDVYYIE